MASGRIKGITIEIDGNTTKLQQSLSGVDKSLKETEKNLKDVNKLLKLDPKNTELLAQKQANLKKAIGETKDRLDKLKEAQSQLKQGTPEWDALQREIIDTQQKLSGLEKEYKEFGSVAKQKVKAVADETKELGKKISDAGKKVTDFGTGMTTKVTAPIAAVGVASIASFKSVDAGLDTIIKKTGATGESADEMKAILESIATTVPTDFETAGAAIGEVNTRFGLTGTALESLSTQFIKFAELNNTDVSTSIDSVQKALASYGLSAESAEGYLDILNKTAQNTGVPVDSLTTGLVSNATAFQEMGLSIDQATVFMGQLETSGANSETVLNGMRKALKNATKEGKPLDQALSDLQETILNGSDSMDGLTAAYDIFGKSGDQIYGAVKNGTLDFSNLATAVEDAGGSVTDTFEATVDPVDEFTTTLNQLKITGAEVGGTILTLLAPAIDKVQEVIALVKEKWDALSPGTQEAIVQAGLIAAAVGPVIVIIGSVISGIGSIVTGIGGLIGAVGLLLSPLGLVVAAIAAVVAIGVVLYKNWDKICEWAGKVKEKVVEAWNNLKKNVTEAVTNVKQKVTEQWNALKTGVTNAATTVKEKVSGAWDTIKTKSSAVWELVKTNISTKWDEMKEKVSTVAGNIKTAVSEKFTAAKQKASEIWSLMKSNVSTKWSEMKTSITEKAGSIKSTISEKFGAAKDKALEIFGNIKSGIEEKINNAKQAVSNAIDKIKGFFNFSWSLPSLKMPHFSIVGEFSLKPPSVPHLSVEWYRKAYENPYLFTSPTVIGGKGFGDGNGAELVYGYENLMRDIANAKGGDNITINVYANEGINVNQLADQIQRRLTFEQNQRARVYA